MQELGLRLNDGLLQGVRVGVVLVLLVEGLCDIVLRMVRMTVVPGVGKGVSHVNARACGLAHDKAAVLALLHNSAADGVTGRVGVHRFGLLHRAKARSVELLTVSIGVVGEVLLAKRLLVALVENLGLVLVVRVGLRVVKTLGEHDLIVAFVVWNLASLFVSLVLGGFAWLFLIRTWLHKLPLGQPAGHSTW